MAMQYPQLYRGTSEGVRYTGFDWKAATYLTDDFETAALCGRFGRIERATPVGDINTYLAEDALVRKIEKAANPARVALNHDVQAIWNPSSQWIGRVHPHEFVVFMSGLFRFEPITKTEQRRAEKIATLLQG
jgi:hypothetical protein